MKNTPQLDKIIGSSPIYPNTFDIHYSSGVCAFPSHGYLSIINIKIHQRFDVQISQNFRNISALKFSSNENQLAVGELGTNSKIIVLTFNNSFDQVISKLSIDTKENGFSCLAFDSKKGRLISVGADLQPFLILWDLNHPNPIKLGYYHLSVQPNKVIFNSDCSLAVVAGEGVLKLIQTNFSYENKPILMKSRRANFDTYTDSDFVDIYCTKGIPFNLYALCYEGKLCFYQEIDNPFLKHQKSKKASLVLTPIKLSRGNLTSLAADDTIILCGGEKGTIFAFKNQNNKLKVAGKLVAMSKSVISVGISEKFITSTYEDGHLLFWNKEDLLQMDNNGKQTKNVLPEITIFNHRGPICKILVIKPSQRIVSCGSDNSIRLWEIHKHQDLISNSSQEMVNCLQFGSPEPDYVNNYFGVRTATFLDDLLITGCHDGIVHILRMDTFEEIISFIDSIDAVTSLASLEDKSYFASGSGDGGIRLYSVEKKDDNEYDYTLVTSKTAFTTPITSLIFTNSFLFSTSQTGVKFFSIPSLEEISYYQTTEPILSSTYIEKADLIATASCDCYISLFDSKSGKFFNRFTLSNNYYPVAIDCHESGLVLAVAMSDGIVLVVDIITGQPIYSFDPLLGVITSIAFHENDLVISSFSGCIARWNLPDSFHKEIELSMKKNSQKHSQAILDLIDSLPKPSMHPSSINIEEESDYEEEEETNKITPVSNSGNLGQMELRSSVISTKLVPKCEIDNDQLNNVLDEEKSIENDENDEDKNPSKEPSFELIGDIDDPRPPPNVISPDSIIRSSIRSRKKLSESKDSSEMSFHINKKDDDQEGYIEVLSIPETRPKRKPIPLDFGPADSLKAQSPSPNPILSLKEKVNTSKNQNNDGQKDEAPIKPLNPEEIERMTGNFMVDSSSSDDENNNNNDNDNNDNKADVNDSKQMDEHQKLANEIIETASILRQCIEKAKMLLNENYTDDDDVQAQQNLRNLLDSYNTQEIRRKEITQKMKDASQKLLDLSSQAEKMSADATQLASTFSNE